MLKDLKKFFNKSSFATKCWTGCTGVNILTAGLYFIAANPGLGALYLGLAALNVALAGMYWEQDKRRDNLYTKSQSYSPK
jgi:hypothetical protein